MLWPGNIRPLQILEGPHQHLVVRRGRGPRPCYEVAFSGVKTSFLNGMAESTGLAYMEHVAKIRIGSIIAKVWAFTMDLGSVTAFSWIP